MKSKKSAINLNVQNNLKHNVTSAVLTQMDNVGELNMAAATILVDAADTEAVVPLDGHAVPCHLRLGGRLGCEALAPLLGAGLLPLHHED